MQHSPYQLEYAKLNWRDDNPESSEFGDIYFSRSNGLAETDYVFLQHNRLAQRFAALDPSQPSQFVIAETGFGTGLNFLAAWQLWQQHAPANWRLQFVSVEKHPLRHSDLSRALRAWPELNAFSDALLANYPHLIPGLHSIALTSSVELLLWLGDASEGFEQCLDSVHPAFAHLGNNKVDAWFLDGFAPAKNPAMWSDELFAAIGALSKPGTSFATFTAAGIVRRGLKAQGFRVNKVPGFGQKREMICGEMEQNITTTTLAQCDKNQSAWSALPPSPKPQTALVIGGGLAGTTTAYALAKRGIAVTLLERHQDLASEASGNAQGMLYTKLSHQDGTLNRFAMASFLYALRYYSGLLASGILPASAMAQCGLLQLAVKEKEQATLNKIAQAFASHPELVEVVDAARASELAGLPCQHPGYWLRQSGWIAPPQLCRALANTEGINTLLTTEALTLSTQANRWQLTHSNGQLTADIVVIANSHDATQFAQSSELPLKIIRGQVSQLDADALAYQPQAVICHEGYVTPPIDGQLRFGATFDNGDSSKAVRSEDHQRNVDSLQNALPALFNNQENRSHVFTGRANLRCSTPDYLPMVGVLPVRDTFITQYAALAKDASKPIATAGSYYSGLYLNVGHGSRGLTSTPLCAEYIAALACHSMRPMPRQLTQALHPARFLLRDIIRGNIAQ